MLVRPSERRRRRGLPESQCALWYCPNGPREQSRAPMHLISQIEQALGGAWTGIYVRMLAVILAYGALVHIGNIAGLSGRPWIETPVLWRVMDVVLLIFNVAVGVALWLRMPWGVMAFVVGIVGLQLIPYTLFRDHFIESPEQAQALNGLIGTHLVLLAVLACVIVLRK